MSDKRPTILNSDPASQFAREKLLEDKCLSLQCALPATDQFVVRKGRGRWASVKGISEIRRENVGTGGQRSNRLSGSCEIRDGHRGGADVPGGRRGLRRAACGERHKRSQAKRAVQGERRHSPSPVFKLPRIRGHSATANNKRPRSTSAKPHHMLRKPASFARSSSTLPPKQFSAYCQITVLGLHGGMSGANAGACAAVVQPGSGAELKM